MNSNASVVNGHGCVVARAGVLLFTLSLLNGFLIHTLRLPRLGLSAHLVGLVAASILLALGGWWPRLQQSVRASRAMAALAIYGLCCAWLVYFFASASGAGGMFPLSAGGAQGSGAMEGAVSVAMATVALALFALCAMSWRALGTEHNWLEGKS